MHAKLEVRQSPRGKKPYQRRLRSSQTETTNAIGHGRLANSEQRTATTATN